MSNHKWRNRSGTPTWQSWYAAMRRCTNPDDPSWDDYGGRGIAMCVRWVDDFDAFFEDMGERPDGLTLDRIDNEGPYSPDNCRWASRQVQNENQRSTHWLTHNGETHTAAEWCRRLGLHQMTVNKRIHAGWPVDKILSTEKFNPDPYPCGTAASYNRGCRCDGCREAKRIYRKSIYRPKVA